MRSRQHPYGGQAQLHAHQGEHICRCTCMGRHLADSMLYACGDGTASPNPFNVTDVIDESSDANDQEMNTNDD